MTTLSRRGLFGFVARAAAAVGLAKIAAAMPEVQASPAKAAAPDVFRGQFTFPDTVVTSMSCVIVMPRGTWDRMLGFHGDPFSPRLTPAPWRPETLAQRVRRHVAESRETRWRARTPARLFWGLP